MDLQTYQAGIDLLQEKDPGNIWIKELSGKYSFVNTKSLQAELDKLAQSSAKKELTAGKKKVRNPSSNPVLRDLYQQRTKVFTQRAKTTNKFHVCETDAERAAVSVDIQMLQRQWTAITVDIDTYERTGQLPKTAAKYPVPKSAIERLKLRNTLRSQISNKKSALRKKAIEHGKTTDANRQQKIQHQISKAEAKLKDLETHKAYVEAAIKD